MVYDVVGLVDKKYIVDPLSSEDNIDYDYENDQGYDYDVDSNYNIDDLSEVYNSTHITPRKQKSNSNVIEIIKEKLINLLANMIVKTDCITVLGDDEDDIVEYLTDYSLEDLLYIKKALQEYETMDEISEDYFNLFLVDKEGQLNFL